MFPELDDRVSGNVAVSQTECNAFHRPVPAAEFPTPDQRIIEEECEPQESDLDIGDDESLSSGQLAAVVAGAVVGLLLVSLVIFACAFSMRRRSTYA